MNIFKKCFWIGHEQNSHQKANFTVYDDWCKYCETNDCYEEPLGVKILEGLKPVGIVLLFVLAFIVLLFVFFGIAYPIGIGSCKQFAEQNGLAFVYKFWYGCMVNYNGHWISPENVVLLFK